MLIYVASKYDGNPVDLERASSITHDLQVSDLANSYISPLLTFSHLGYGELEHDDEMELCFDLLSTCDRLIVASDISREVQAAIDFAKLVKMEVMRLEEDGTLQPFTE